MMTYLATVRNSARVRTSYAVSRHAIERSRGRRPCLLVAQLFAAAYVHTRMDVHRLGESALRSLRGCRRVFILTCMISLFTLAHAGLSASEEREAHLQKAIDELLAGRPLAAVTDASKAVEVNPRSAEALAILGMSQLKCGEWGKAESRLNEAVAVDSLLPEAHLGLGVIAVSQMRCHDAIPHLRRATLSQLFPGAAYRALALSLEDLNLHQEASQAMREASKYSDDIPADQLANVSSFADIFAAHDGLSLHRIPDDFKSTSVHIDHEQDHVTVPVVLNGTSRCDLVLDTGFGGSLMLNAECAEGLNLTYVGAITTISMAGELRLEAAVLDSIRIGGLVMSDVPVFVCEHYPFQSGGLIGWKVIQRVNTVIDFEQMQMRLFSQNNPEAGGKRITDEENTECIPFVYLTSMFVIARFGDDLPKAYVFDTGAYASCLHSSYGNDSQDAWASSSRSLRIGDLTFDVPNPQFLDFSAIHKKGRYYFPGVIGLDIMWHNVVHILPRESMLCMEKRTL
jgi:tetratricopeptide (TPR) repeat protein